MDEAITRGHAYAQAGADGLFVPGLTDLDLIGRLCRGLKIPVNVMVSPGSPPAEDLAAAGVARISHGFGPMQVMMGALAKAAGQALQPAP